MNRIKLLQSVVCLNAVACAEIELSSYLRGKKQEDTIFENYHSVNAYTSAQKRDWYLD